jgi:hypothetical protein
MTDNHAKRNVIQHRQLVLSKTMKQSASWRAGAIFFDERCAIEYTPSQNIAEYDVHSGRNKTSQIS